MANPLKMLKLKPTTIQIIQEVPIDAPPAKVWRAVLDAKAWIGAAMMNPKAVKSTVEPKVGGRFTYERGDGSEQRLLGFISHVEPNKLLRVYGPGVMSHLPCACTMIWELQPAKGGKATVLRFCERSYGSLPPGTAKSHQGGWKMVLAKLKKAAEG